MMIVFIIRLKYRLILQALNLLRTLIKIIFFPFQLKFDIYKKL